MEEISRIEDMVNAIIEESVVIDCTEMSLEQAQKEGAEGVFGDRYESKVKVYTMGNYSKEICGGPHAKNTKELGKFKITKEQSSSSGVRRIKATISDS